MRGDAVERKTGLEVEWGERGIERRPLTAEGINTGGREAEGGGGSSAGAKGTRRETRERQLPPLL